jgi:hypothetical protein
MPLEEWTPPSTSSTKFNANSIQYVICPHGHHQVSEWLTILRSVGTEWDLLWYRLVLEPCNTASPPDFRSNQQLFLPQQNSTSGITFLYSALDYPQCTTCGTDVSLCVSACPDLSFGGRHCAEYLPPPTAAAQHTLAMANFCW